MFRSTVASAPKTHWTLGWNGPKPPITTSCTSVPGKNTSVYYLDASLFIYSRFIQSLVRRNRAMRRYSVLHIRVHDIESAIVIQASFRRYSALISLCQGKEGAIKIQSIVRMHIGRISYLSIKSAAVFVQSRFRWVVARNIYLVKKMAVARIQSQATKESNIQKFGREQNAAMSIQRSTRLFLARQKSILCLASHEDRSSETANLLQSHSALIIRVHIEAALTRLDCRIGPMSKFKMVSKEQFLWDDYQRWVLLQRWSKPVGEDFLHYTSFASIYQILCSYRV